VSIDSRELLSALAREPVISGGALAAQFGVTRAAIWKQIESLRELGVPICARAGAGYSLSTPLDLLDAPAIHAALPPATASRLGRIDVRWQVDSTNSELLRGEFDPDQPIAACFAEFQSAGRGRRGRTWQSPLGGGLAFSLRWRSESSMAALAGLSLAIGVGVVRALHDMGYGDIGLKWPNDLQWRGKKLGGILVELGGDALGPCHAVIGVGLNLRLDPHTAARIDQPWTDLASIRATGMPDRNRLAARMLARLIEVLDQFSVHTFSPFVDAFAQYDVLRGKPVCVHGGRGVCEGIADGVDRHGALRLRTPSGDQVVDSGEVSVRPSPGGSA
jgi:BirA family biotin operon repressor/biotin-[acetyl-CoA-carboxylase] ligase